MRAFHPAARLRAEAECVPWAQPAGELVSLGEKPYRSRFPQCSKSASAPVYPAEFRSQPRSGSQQACLEPVMNFPGRCVADENRCKRGGGRSLGYSKARTTTKCGAICTATRRAGVNFPDFRVALRSDTPGIRRSSLLEFEKIDSQRRTRESS